MAWCARQHRSSELLNSWDTPAERPSPYAWNGIKSYHHALTDAYSGGVVLPAGHENYAENYLSSVNPAISQAYADAVNSAHASHSDMANILQHYRDVNSHTGLVNSNEAANTLASAQEVWNGRHKVL